MKTCWPHDAVDSALLNHSGWRETDGRLTSAQTAANLPCSGEQRSELTRMVLDTAAGGVARSRLSTRACEFSTINPQQNGRQNRYAYVPASAVDDPVKSGPNQVGLCLELGSTWASLCRSTLLYWLNVHQEAMVAAVSADLLPAGRA
jgi:Retinal pigment epithelial membrane protein